MKLALLETVGATYEQFCCHTTDACSKYRQLVGNTVRDGSLWLCYVSQSFESRLYVQEQEAPVYAGTNQIAAINSAQYDDQA